MAIQHMVMKHWSLEVQVDHEKKNRFSASFFLAGKLYHAKLGTIFVNSRIDFQGWRHLHSMLLVSGSVRHIKVQLCKKFQLTTQSPHDIM